MRHIVKKGELPKFPSWIELLSRRIKSVFIPETQPKKQKKINDGMIFCKCKKCRQRLPRSEMIQPLPDQPNYLLTPECAARRAARKERYKKMNLIFALIWFAFAVVILFQDTTNGSSTHPMFYTALICGNIFIACR